MRLPSVPTLPMVEHLNSTYFHSVWNSPDDHGRANFRLQKAADRLQIGAVPVNLSVVGLPTTDKVYAVYRVPNHVFGRFVTFVPNIWIKDSDILEDHGVSITTYSETGRVIPTGKICLRYDQLRDMVLIAIDFTYTSKCIGRSFPDLYMTVYKDTSRNTPTTSQTYQVSNTFGAVVTAQSVTQAINSAIASLPAGTSIFVNGFIYDNAHIPALVVGDVVEIFKDPDIVGYCDIQVDDNQTGYYSNLYNEYREILHIPKALNPLNFVITHDTLNMAVFDTASKKGVYAHRIDNHSVESITHNDFSMSRAVLQAFENGLSSQNITLRIYVRFATTPYSLGGDVNHLNDLYTLPDDEIKRQLAGLSSHQILEWKAAHLEQSEYLDLLYHFNGFKSNNIIPKYTNAMGYFDVASTLSQAMHYYTYKGAQVEIRKPARLIGYQCDIIVYANGRKVPNYAFEVMENSGSTFLLGFKSDSYITLNTRIGVYVAESGSRIAQDFIPTALQPEITLPNEDYTVFEITEYLSPQPVWEDTTDLGYHEYPMSPADYTVTLNSNGTATFRIGSLHYNKSFYFVPKYGLTTKTYSLDTILTDKKPIIIPLKSTDIDGNIIPLLGYAALEVYINGYRLIENVDYTCTPVMGTQSDILQQLLQVSNMDYFDIAVPGNILEVVVHGDKAVSTDSGYVISNLMHREKPPMVWSRSCGRVYARGLLIEQIVETGNTLESYQDIEDGAPYYLEWSLPYGVSKLLSSVEQVDDTNLRFRLDAILNLTVPEYPDIVVINQLYALYSPYLATIVSDVASGAFIIADEAKEDLFLKQFSKYKILYDRDPLIGVTNELIDRRFVTLAAHYTNFAVLDPQQMILVQRLITLLLTPSELSINEVLI